MHMCLASWRPGKKNILLSEPPKNWLVVSVQRVRGISCRASPSSLPLYKFRLDLFALHLVCALAEIGTVLCLRLFRESAVPCFAQFTSVLSPARRGVFVESVAEKLASNSARTQPVALISVDCS